MGQRCCCCGGSLRLLLLLRRRQELTYGNCVAGKVSEAFLKRERAEKGFCTFVSVVGWVTKGAPRDFSALPLVRGQIEGVRRFEAELEQDLNGMFRSREETQVKKRLTCVRVTLSAVQF